MNGKWLRRGLAAVLATASVLTGCGSRVAEAQPSVVGMSVRLIGAAPADVARQFDLMAQMNVKIVRTDFDWSAIEGQRGTFDWSYPDLIVSNARRRGMDVLALLTYTPGWARPAGTDSHVPPSRATDFAAFAQAAATRYAPDKVRDWEIWNEPNSSDYWAPRPDVDRYSELLAAAAAAIHAVDSGATVVTGGLTRGTSTDDGRRISQADFVEGLYRTGAARAANAIGIHPYSFPALPSAPGGPIGGFADLPSVYGVMQRAGDGGKKIWVTEFGAPTGTAPGAMSEADQAASLLQAGQLAQSWPWIGPVIVYELRDSGTSAGDLEQNFGVLRADLSPKDAGKALKG